METIRYNITGEFTPECISALKDKTLIPADNLYADNEYISVEISKNDSQDKTIFQNMYYVDTLFRQILKYKKEQEDSNIEILDVVIEIDLVQEKNRKGEYSLPVEVLDVLPRNKNIPSPKICINFLDIIEEAEIIEEVKENIDTVSTNVE